MVEVNEFNLFFTEGDPNLSVYCVRTVPYPTVFREGPYRSIAPAYRTFFYRLNADSSFKREPYRPKTRTIFRDFNIKNHKIFRKNSNSYCKCKFQNPATLARVDLATHPMNRRVDLSRSFN